MFAKQTTAYCSDGAVSAMFELELGALIAVYLGSAAFMMGVTVLLSQKYDRFHEAIMLLATYFVLLSFVVGHHCVNWAMWASFGLLALLFALMLCVWLKPDWLIKPEGKLSFLL